MTAQAATIRLAEAAEAPIPVLTHDEAVAAARALGPRIRARAERADADRQLPRESVEEMVEAGLFGVTMPRRYGGSGLGFDSLVEVATEIGSACGSSGWVYGVLAGHNIMAALFSQKAQAEIFADPRVLISTVFRLAGKVSPEDDGYRLTGGEGRFCSGVDFAQWVMVGNAVQRDGQPPEPGFFLVPISEVEVVDDWFTAGMRGTGSKTIKIADAYIPPHRFIRQSDIQKGETPGAAFLGEPRYRLPTGMSQPFSLIGAALGLARGAVREFADNLGKRCGSQSAEQIGEQSATFARLAAVSAEADAAFTIVMDNARMIDGSDDPAAFTLVQRAKIKRDVAYAAQKARHAVNSLFEASGGSGIYDGAPLQRMWRDINGATAHVAFTWDVAASNYGRAIAGLPPSKFTPV